MAVYVFIFSATTRLTGVSSISYKTTTTTTKVSLKFYTTLLRLLFQTCVSCLKLKNTDCLSEPIIYNDNNPNSNKTESCCVQLNLAVIYDNV